MACSRAASSKVFKTTVLGGTFDHLHAGHKKLLLEAVNRATHKVVIGLSDGSLLENKKFKEYMESYDTRERILREFLVSLNPDLTYEIVKITDPYGPTLTSAELDAIIVSEETVKGAAKINELRQSESHLPPLEVIVVDCLPSDVAGEKLSSTQLREQEMLRTQQA
mmetsp:Transcript_13822/g.35260  ORF Transcript_13822/g.35260 Transcript_13822/m.35260 type:complete len:166 (+) Transcript_13822:62-559(+)